MPVSINISQAALAALLRFKGESVHVPQQHLHLQASSRLRLPAMLFTSADAQAGCGLFKPELEGLCDSPQPRLFQTKHPASLGGLCTKTHGLGLPHQVNRDSIAVRSNMSGIKL